MGVWMMQGINEKVRAFVIRFCTHKEIQDTDNLFEQKIVNSLFSMQLVMFVEKEFSIQVENDDLEMSNFCSIDAITRFISKKLKIER